MSIVRTANFLLRPFKLRLERTDRVGLMYPRSNWKLSLLSSALWAAFAFYLASYFSVDPTIGERSAYCLVERSTSFFSILVFTTALLAALFYFVLQHGTGRITAASRTRWFLVRFLVAFSLTFSNFLSKLGAVSFGVGLYAIFVNPKAGAKLMVLGAVFLAVGSVFANQTLPIIFSFGPKVAKYPLARGLLAMSAAVGAALLIIGLSTGTLRSTATPDTGCHLIIRYE
jgi:hypothetical protein